MKGRAIVLLMALVAIILFAAPNLLSLSVYPSGWELYNQVGALRHHSTVLDDETDFTFPQELMGVYWKVDLDDPHYGVATIQVEMGDLRHVDFMGKETPSNQPVDTILFQRGNFSYYLDYHIYLYTVTIRTIADKHQYQGDWWTVPAWEHETSWPHELWNGPLGDGGRHEKIGKAFDGGIYVKFIIDPWTGYTYRDPPESGDAQYRYDLYGCWAGVMNTYIFDRVLGQVENQWSSRPEPDSDAPLYVKGGLDRGHQVPMFKDDGSYGEPVPRVRWDPDITPDERLESGVVQYLPVQMLPGASVNHDWLGVAYDLYPCDVYVMYTLRVDVLTSHGFILHSAEAPPEPKPPLDYFVWYEGFWASLFHANPFAVFGPFSGLAAFLFTLLVVAVVVLVVVAIVAPQLLARLVGGSPVALL